MAKWRIYPAIDLDRKFRDVKMMRKSVQDRARESEGLQLSAWNLVNVTNCDALSAECVLRREA